jgi:hypothetical protein
MFVGIIPIKPSKDFTRPLGMPRGLKVLLHVLNAIVSPTTEDLYKGLAKCKFGGV